MNGDGVGLNYTYMVKCADGTLYTGWTNCLQKRLKAHNEPKNGAKYTKAKRPVSLVYHEAGISDQAAHQRKEAGSDGVLTGSIGSVSRKCGLQTDDG